MRFHEITEAHYELSRGTELSAPLEASDTITVYHNFRDLQDAIGVIQHGLSGRSRASRVYSYEADNNPYGLFVSPDFKTIDEFGSTIIEFVARISDLEPPVWPSGSYTVYGGHSQYWGHGREGTRKRRSAQKKLRTEYRSDQSISPAIQQSHDPLLAYTLTQMGEQQALFVGHLNPNDIVRIFVRKDNRINSWEEISREEFLQRNAQEVEQYQSNRREHSDKIFKPTDEFDSNKFVQGLSKRFKIDVLNTLKSIWQHQILSQRENRSAVFKDIMGHYLWPKQMPQAYRWFGKTFGSKPVQENFNKNTK